jgi:hypothetical protein
MIKWKMKVLNSKYNIACDCSNYTNICTNYFFITYTRLHVSTLLGHHQGVIDYQRLFYIYIYICQVSICILLVLIQLVDGCFDVYDEVACPIFRCCF